MQNVTARSQVRRVLLITLVFNLLIAAGKIFIGLTSGALSITADGFHSLIDGTSNVIGLVGNAFAALPPDDEHPYGHRRFETLAALMIGAFLILVAWEIINGAFQRLTNGEQPDITLPMFVILIGTLLVNIGVSTYQIRQGKRLRSEVLLADAANTRADVFITLSVLISMVLVRITGLAWIDLVAAGVVVVLISHAAWHILNQTGRVLVDTAPYSPEMLEALIQDVPQVTKVLRARSRGSADAAHVDIDVMVAPALTAQHSAAITNAIRNRIENAMEGVLEIEVHFVPDDAGEQGYALIARAAADALGLGTHEVYLLEGDRQRVLEMHVEVPPAQTLVQAHQLVSRLEAEIQQQLPDVDEVITHIEPAASEIAIQNDTQRCKEVTDKVLGLLRTHYPRVGWHHLRVYDGYEGMSLTMHAALYPEISVEVAHNIAERAETLLRASFPTVNRVTIHTEPIDQKSLLSG